MTKELAAVLGWTFPRWGADAPKDHPSLPYRAAWRQDGSAFEIDGDTEADVLSKIAEYHALRARRHEESGSAAVGIQVGVGVAGPGQAAA